jgi:hypothetical protein
MNVYGGVWVEFKAFLTSAQGEGGCTSSRPIHFIERKELPVPIRVDARWALDWSGQGSGEHRISSNVRRPHIFPMKKAEK